ncbi:MULTISPECIES: RecT family recombinase [Virgibacillus]|uniref:RecT family recombinase n=1 Tax=Virgibacillus TaxID=84406 RepID=UPI000EF49768|nr:MULTISPECIES: RecT family recombinase [Virgibacillus]WBX80148.1 recombinase RecT [Virgibacillus salarius]
MANNQLATVKGMEFGELSEQDVLTIRQTLAKDCNDSQFKLFMSIAKSSGANPVMNEIYPAVRAGQLTVQFAVEFFVRKSKESDGYKGHDVQLVHENDEFKMHQEKDDQDRYFAVIDEHSWGFPRGKVIGGYAIAYRENMKPFTVVMEVDEVEHFKKSQIGMQKTMWTNYFNDMFKKHMLRRALKAAYDLNFDDEVAVEGKGDNGVPEYQHRERKDITPNQETITEPKEEQPENKIASLREQMKSKFKQLGITTNAKIGKYLEDNNVKMSDPATESELIGLIELLDRNIELQELQAADDDELPE